jgi:hypothetical protein
MASRQRALSAKHLRIEQQRIFQGADICKAGLPENGEQWNSNKMNAETGHTICHEGASVEATYDAP